jgi:pimeloyl-ACP methyl ester carboxylesterase
MRLVRKSIFGNAVNFPSANLAKALNVPQLPKRYRDPVHTDVPSLFISGELDSRTPPRNAEEVRRSFSRSGHLVIQGAGHDNDLFLSTPTILDRIDSFLDRGILRDEKVVAAQSGG